MPFLGCKVSKAALSAALTPALPPICINTNFSVLAAPEGGLSALIAEQAEHLGSAGLRVSFTLSDQCPMD